MSRAFVKEGDGALEPLPDLPISPHPNYVTPRGLAVLKARLALVQADLAAIKAAADRLDKLPQAAAERDIRYLEARLRSAIVVHTDASAGVVEFGTAVTLRDDQGRVRKFEIVGEDEADAALGRIAPQSPLARALIGCEVGDLVEWLRPTGAAELEILQIDALDPNA